MSRNEIQAVLFDLDGTIIDARERLLASCQQTFRQLDLRDVDEATCWEAIRNYGLEKLVPDSMRAQFFALLLDRYMAYPGQVRVIPGAAETLQFCRERGYRTAVMTARSSSPEEVRAELEGVGLASYIDVIKTQEGVPIMDVLDKARRLLDAIEELGIVPDRSIYIGDSPDDISSARCAGLGRSIAVLSGGIRRELLAEREPDAILNSIEELPAYLRDM